MMTVFLELMNFESALCNDCGHTKNNDGVCIDWSLYLDNSSNHQTIRGVATSVNGRNKGRIFRKLDVDECHKINASTKAVYVTVI